MARGYGGVSAEQRRSERRTALLEAAMDVLPDGLTVRGVCGHAKLNDRYFYEHFRDCAELLKALAEREGAGAVAVVMDVAATPVPDMRAQVRRMVEAAIGFVCDDPRRGRVWLAVQVTESLYPMRYQMIRRLADIMAAHAYERLGERAPAEPDTTMAAFTLVSGGFDLFCSWLRGDLDVSRARLTDFLVAMILATADLTDALTGSD
ncbi:TetR/AcrR family transcriptional regulator [Kibdelosporangium philippinense]|uniref:TetR/AcrR family transcriptional regulator n=1 Tax=Kibdelosporangium philippinense TaxID=211113 RepID=A0ABS8Z0N1_9PSEU|nr:TetR/AcrR family transcriptional regulator [Kibdelosporangium philippinense]MCE7001534.1 TetR/AcrR family transcriptional regulator [Kibdelosporangium philippinense]